jgi:hypothetical protein
MGGPGNQLSLTLVVTTSTKAAMIDNTHRARPVDSFAHQSIVLHKTVILAGQPAEPQKEGEGDRISQGINLRLELGIRQYVSPTVCGSPGRATPHYAARHKGFNFCQTGRGKKQFA